MSEGNQALTVPDGITPIRAYRGWRAERWRGLSRLKSLTQEIEWPVNRPLAAECIQEFLGPMFVRAFWNINYAIRWSGTSSNTPAPVQVAGAEEEFTKAKEHLEPPHADCMCGVWGVGDPWKIKKYDEGWANETALVGVVALWGKVVIGSEGWRAQFARPVEIVSAPKFPRRSLRARRQTARLEEQVSEAYGIPVLDYWPEITPLEA